MPKLFSILLVVTFHFSLAWAQVTTGTVLGTVQDATGAVLPGTEVTVTHLDTSISRTVISDDEGRYQLTNLNLGNYEVAASLPGFQTEVQTGIEMTIGRRAVVNFSLNVGEITERVTVTSEAPLVETTSGSLGDLVDRKTVLELPLNGRDMTQLLTLQAGTAFVTTGGAAGEGGANGGFSQRVSIGGARPHDSAVLMDGNSVKGSDQGVPAGVSGNFLGGEAVQEFKIERNAYSAAYGGASGGTINVVSKAGTNEFHGSIYNFHRNDNLDATHYFSNRDGLNKAPFIRNQYGFSVGGPIIENKTFFFWNFEGMRERKSNPDRRTLPDENMRNGLLRLDSGGDDVTAGAPLVDMSTIAGFDPKTLRYLTLFPTPTGPFRDDGDGTLVEFFDSPRPVNEDYYTLRIDHNFSESDTLFGRYSWLNSDRTVTHDIPFWTTEDQVNNDFVTLEEKHIFSPQLLNTFRAGINRRLNGQESFEEANCCDTSLRFVPDDKFKRVFGTAEPTQGEFAISGLSAIGLGAPGGSATGGWVRFKTTNYQWQDDVIYNKGPHSAKLGFSWHRVDFGGDNPSRIAGQFSFSNIVDFMKNEPSRFRGNILEDSDGLRDFHMDIIAWYIQDDWQISPKLSANLGFRHEFYTVPNEVDGKFSNLKDPQNDSTFTINGQFPDGTCCTDDKWFLNPSLKSFMPRIGFAYDPTGSGKTAIRLGAGLFYNHVSPGAFRRAGFRSAPHMKEQNFRSGVDGTFGPGDDPSAIFLQVTTQGLGFEDMQPFAYDYLRNPHMYQWNLNIQQEVMPGAAVTIGYAGSRGMNLFHQTCVNFAEASREIIPGRLTYAPDAAVPNQSELFSDLCMLNQETSTDSWYHSLQTGFQRRFRDGWQLQASYTFSRTIDEASQINGAFANNNGGVSYPAEPDLRRSLAAYHVANAFSVSSVIELPFGQGKAFGNSWNGVTDTILGGWQLSNILRLASGPAASIIMSTPNDLIRLGFNARGTGNGMFLDFADGFSDNSPVLGTKDSFNYFDISAFAPPPESLDSRGRMRIRTLGTLGRNTLSAPGVANLDFSLTKNNQVTETVNVQFRAEFFNALNRANFREPDSRIFGSSGGSPRSTAGELTRTSTRNRQVQFGLRITF